MTTDQYIRRVIKGYTVTQGVASRAILTARQLYPRVRIWGRILGATDKTRAVTMSHNYILRIHTTGSIVKGTSIVGGTDLDLFISLSHRTPGTLESIYNSLTSYLKLLGLSTRKQNVSIGINYKGLSIDLVPGKKQSGPTNDHSIYRSKLGTWTKTNIHKHVSFVKKSGRINEIRAIKIWRKLHGLDFPSFYLELSVIEALKGRFLGRLAVNLQKVFEYLSSDFKNARILDPANSSNVVSEDLNDQEKKTIARTALSSCVEALQGNWHRVIW